MVPFRASIIKIAQTCSYIKAQLTCLIAGPFPPSGILSFRIQTMLLPPPHGFLRACDLHFMSVTKMTVTYVIQFQDNAMLSAFLISLTLLLSSTPFCRELGKLNFYCLYYVNITWSEFWFKIGGMWIVYNKNTESSIVAQVFSSRTQEAGADESFRVQSHPSLHIQFHTNHGWHILTPCLKTNITERNIGLHYRFSILSLALTFTNKKICMSLKLLESPAFHVYIHKSSLSIIF